MSAIKSIKRNAGKQGKVAELAKAKAVSPKVEAKNAKRREAEAKAVEQAQQPETFSLFETPVMQAPQHDAELPQPVSPLPVVLPPAGDTFAPVGQVAELMKSIIGKLTTAVFKSAPQLMIDGKMQGHARGIAYSVTRPGTISAMLEALCQATAEQPVTKQQILDYAIARCGKCNIATVQMQVPSGLMIEKGIEVSKSGAGYFVKPEEFSRYEQATTVQGLTMKQYALLRKRERAAKSTEAQ